MSAIRRQINIAAAPRTVWRALTTPEGLAGWWATAADTEARVEPREGGRIVFSTGEGEAIAELRGIIHTWRPTSHLELAFDKVGSNELRGSLTAFKLARDGDETRLTLVHSGGEALDDVVRRAFLEKAWDKALNALQSRLDEP